MWWKANRWKIIIPVIILLALAAAFFLGGRLQPEPSGTDAASSLSGTEETALPPADMPDFTPSPEPEERPAPVDPEEMEATDTEYHCTFSISCATILDNMELCNKDKRELVPEDGWILEPVEVVFYDGESVFNVLQRTCRQNRIHLEFAEDPLYGSAYIEGIYNLYEQDVGELSGWMYSVNGWFPNYGCSRYALKDGDTVEWRYTCDLGADVGDPYNAQQG